MCMIPFLNFFVVSKFELSSPQYSFRGLLQTNNLY